jgi:hypothetical protein
VQLRLDLKITLEEYVAQNYWLKVVLDHCPLHPKGGCGMKKLGYYWRTYPVLLGLARWYCFLGHMTFSLLPDFLASRVPGTLNEVEDAVLAYETAPTVADAADAMRRPDVDDGRKNPITLEATVGWLWRRARLVHAALLAVTGIYPVLFSGCPASILALQKQLATDSVLVALRGIAALHLASLPPPLGFGPRPKPREKRFKPAPHNPWPDRPP